MGSLDAGQFFDGLGVQLDKSMTPLADRFARKLGVSFTRSLATVSKSFATGGQQMAAGFEAKLFPKLNATLVLLNQIEQKYGKVADAAAKAASVPAPASRQSSEGGSSSSQKTQNIRATATDIRSLANSNLRNGGFTASQLARLNREPGLKGRVAQDTSYVKAIRDTASQITTQRQFDQWTSQYRNPQQLLRDLGKSDRGGLMTRLNNSVQEAARIAAGQTDAGNRAKLQYLSSRPNIQKTLQSAAGQKAYSSMSPEHREKLDRALDAQVKQVETETEDRKKLARAEYESRAKVDAQMAEVQAKSEAAGAAIAAEQKQAADAVKAAATKKSQHESVRDSLLAQPNIRDAIKTQQGDQAFASLPSAMKRAIRLKMGEQGEAAAQAAQDASDKQSSLDAVSNLRKRDYLLKRSDIARTLGTEAGAKVYESLTPEAQRTVKREQKRQQDATKTAADKAEAIAKSFADQAATDAKADAESRKLTGKLLEARAKAAAAAAVEAAAEERQAAMQKATRAYLGDKRGAGFLGKFGVGAAITPETLTSGTVGSYIRGKLLANPYKTESNNYVNDGNGNLVLSRDGTYSRAAGIFRKASTVTVQDGQVQSQEFQRRSSLLGRAWTSVAGDGSKASQAFKAINTTIGSTVKGVSNLFGGVNQLGSALIRLGAIIYGIKRLGTIATDAAIGPLKYITAETEKSRQFELGIQQVVGGRDAARGLNKNLTERAGKSGLGLEDMREIARQMASTPALATRLVGRNADQQGAQVEQFGKIVNQLATLDPVQGAEGSLVAIREGLSGDLTSLKRRLEINPDALASVSGVSRQKLQSDPEAFLKALEKYTDTFIGKEAISGRKDLLSTQLQRTQDMFGQQGAAKIGDSGFYDALVQRVKLFNDRLEQYVSGPQFAQQAQRISELLIHYVESISGIVQQYVEGLTGKTDFSDQVRSLVDMAADGFSHVVDVLQALPVMANKLGEGTKMILGGLASFVDQMTTLARLINNLGLKALIPNTDANVRLQRVTSLATMGDKKFQAEQASATDRVRALEILTQSRKAESPADLATLRTYFDAQEDSRYERQTVVNQYGSAIETMRPRSEEGRNQYLASSVTQAANPTSARSDAERAYGPALDAARRDLADINDIANGSNGAASKMVAGFNAAMKLPDDLRGGVKYGRQVVGEGYGWLRQLVNQKSFPKMKGMVAQGEPMKWDPAIAGSRVNSIFSGLPDQGDFLKSPDYSAAVQYQTTFGQLAQTFEPLSRKIDAVTADASKRGGDALPKMMEQINASLVDYQKNLAGQLGGIQLLIEKAVQEQDPEVQDALRARLTGQFNSILNDQVDKLNAPDGAWGKQHQRLVLPQLGEDKLPDAVRADIEITRSKGVADRANRAIGKASQKCDVSAIQVSINKMIDERVQLFTELAGAKDEVAQGKIKSAIRELNDSIEDATRTRIATMTAKLQRELTLSNVDIGDADQLRRLGMGGRDLSKVDVGQLGAWAKDVNPQDLRERDISALKQRYNAMPGEIDRGLANVSKAQAGVEALRNGGASADEIEAATNMVRDQVQAVEQLSDTYRGLAEDMKKFGLTSAQVAEEQRQNWLDFASSVRDSIESSIGQGLSDAILKAGTFGDAIRNLGQTIVREFVNMQVHNLFLSLFGNAGKQGTDGGGGGLFGDFAGALIRGIAGGATGTKTPASGTPIVKAAKGGVFPGGLQKMATGGVVRKPQAAWIGENISNPSMPSKNGEGVLPLATINGQLGVNAAGLGGAGGGQQAMTVITTGNYAEAHQAATRAFMQSPDGQVLIVDTVTGNVSRGGEVHKAVRAKMGRG